MPTILYFQTALDGLERSKGFYDNVFGSPNRYPAKIEEGLGGQRYYLVVTAVDDKGNKALGGSGLQGYCGIAMLRGISVYVDVLRGGVPSMDQYITRIRESGGRIIIPEKETHHLGYKIEAPGMGYYAVCVDKMDASFAIWEADNSVKGPTILSVLCG